MLLALICFLEFKIKVPVLVLRKQKCLERVEVPMEKFKCGTFLLITYLRRGKARCGWLQLFNPLTPELNPSAQRCLPRLFTGDFAS
jgi:hypothetical protein